MCANATSTSKVESNMENLSNDGVQIETDQSMEFYTSSEKAEQIMLPIICVVGLFGNTVAAVVFLKKPLRQTSCGLYLAVRSIADNGFLATLFFIWLKDIIGLQLSNVPGTCQLVLFLTYVCGFISVWMVVLITVENYFRICRPFFGSHVNDASTAKKVILIVCVASLVMYNFPFWILSAKCLPIPEYAQITRALVYTDTLATLILPMVVIGLLLSSIICHLIKSLNRRALQRVTPLRKRRNSHPTSKVTKMLFAVALVYFTLHLPSHVIRVFILIDTYTRQLGQVEPALTTQGIQKICNLIFYLNFSVNIFVYLCFGENFRNGFTEIFCCSKPILSGNVVDAVELSNVTCNCTPQKPSATRPLLVDTSPDP